TNVKAGEVCALLRIFHVTPIRRILPSKKRAERGDVQLPIRVALLICLHIFQRLPYTDSKAANGILDILDEPATPVALGSLCRRAATDTSARTRPTCPDRVYPR